MVDILMATYNGENFISEQIESIINQTYTDWILYIHDDGSSDRTIEIIKTFDDKRIRLIEDNVHFGNSTKNFMYLIKNCVNSDYFCFSDQDDVWLPNKLEVTLREIEKTTNNNSNIPICIGTNLKVVNEKLNIISESFYDFSKILVPANFSSLLLENSLTGCTMMMNKKVKEYMQNIMNLSDSIIQHDWFIALLCASDGVIKQLDVPTMLYRQHSKNVVGAKSFSILNYFSPKKVYYMVKKVKCLKNKIYKQLEILFLVLNNKENKELIEKFLNTRYFFHKNCMIRKKMIKSAAITKGVVKLFFY